jgi:hypothetical protein
VTKMTPRSLSRKNQKASKRVWPGALALTRDTSRYDPLGLSEDFDQLCCGMDEMIYEAVRTEAARRKAESAAILAES